MSNPNIYVGGQHSPYNLVPDIITQMLFATAAPATLQNTSALLLGIVDLTHIYTLCIFVGLVLVAALNL